MLSITLYFIRHIFAPINILGMKKLILLLFISLYIFTNLSYASFSVVESQQITVVEDENKANTKTPRQDGTYSYALLSVLAVVFGYFMILLTFGAAFGGLAIASTYFVLAVFGMLGAVILGLIGMVRKEKGFALSVLGFLLGILGIIMILGL